jgi:EAL domain-containing protein (putative c-di-GMP-specific phosphodiesterase class I)
VGAVAYPYHGDTAEELLSRADVAMYAAKGSGGACVRFPDADDRLRAGMRSRAEWNERITRSLRDNAFVVFAQPIVRVSTGRIERYELLIRMMEDGQIIPPGEFLPAAEKLGLIKDIDRWMVKQAVTLLSDGVFDGIQVEVNLSGKAFSDPEMIPAMSSALREAHVDPGRLGLEITETAAIADMIHAQTFISALKDFGCRFSLDDFGSGFSSFYYLKHLPIDCLKIDGGFIRDLPHSLQDQHLVRGMADLCKGLGIEAAAEFVEDEETLAMLSDLGIDLVQGFHLGRPMPVSELTHSGVHV